MYWKYRRLIYIMAFIAGWFLGELTHPKGMGIDSIGTTPTLTGEYGQPDGWETLTGQYVE